MSDESPAHEGWFLNFGRELAAALKAAFEQRDARIAELEMRLNTLETAQKNHTYKGVWRYGADYQKDNTVTHDGSLWVALADTFAKPGVDLSWQLCAKKGRDGNDYTNGHAAR